MLIDKWHSRQEDVTLDSPVTIDHKNVDEILSIYRPEHRYVAEARMTDLEMTFKMRRVIYPYTTEQLFDYLTAPTVTLFVCQMIYVLVGGLVLADHPLARVIGGWQRFLSLRDDALLRIGSIKTDYTAQVANQEPIESCIVINKSHAFHSIVHCKIGFHVGKGISGSVHGIILENGDQ